MNINIIVATSLNNAIGVKNQLPWHLPADLKYFKQLTTGHIIVMGRKTFDSIGKPLPNRINIVITRDKNFQHEGIIVKHSVEEVLEHCKDENEIFIIGGDTIYKQTLPIATHLYVTKVDTVIENADAFFPEIDKHEWQLIAEEKHGHDEKNAFDYSFQTYEKIEHD